MKPEQFYIGDIYKCTKYDTHSTFSSETYIDDTCICVERFGYTSSEEELYKENAVLAKVEKGGYVDVSEFKSILDYLKIYKSLTKDGYKIGGIMMPTSAHYLGSLFVDTKSLRPYYQKDQQPNNISILKLNKELKKNNAK